MTRLLVDSRKRIKYDDGSIIRIRMENFMHYDDQTVRPLPGFNVVIGHNGSGKSALVNAICIGLGGNIDTLQRCDNITTFIKREAEEARIEIELYNGSGDNFEVGCSITIKGKVGWAINGERANKTQVEDLVNSLNIQTGNMCQFLPQDVVKNFPLMTPQERFLSTVKAVGEGKLVEQFDRLKEIQKVIDNSDNLIETKENTLESIKNKMEGIKQKKIKMDNIEQVMVNKDIAEKKLKWTRFENDIREAKKIKKKTDEIKQIIAGCKEQIVECKKIDAEKDVEMGKITEKLAVPEKLIQYTERIMMEPMVNKKMMELEHLEQLMKSEEEDRVDKAENLDKTKIEIEKLTRELKHCSGDNAIDIEISKLRDKEHQIDNKIQTLITSKSDLSSKSKNLQQSLRQVQRNLSDLKNAENQKLTQLKKTNPDCYGAVMYIRKNIEDWRQSGKFKHGIHEPAVLTLTVPNLENAVYIEKEAGGQQLEAFVCEDPREANDLMQELRQRFQRVSVIHGDLNKMAQFISPRGERFRSRAAAEDLERYKFVDYVGDMFNGPDAVKVHLYMHTSVYNTAVFQEETPYSEEISDEFPNLRKYYVGKTLNTCRVSKYSKLVSRGEEDISYFKPQRLKINYDQEEIYSLEKQVDDLNKEINTNNKHVQKISDTVVKNKQEITQIKKDIAENNELKVNKSKLEITLKHKKELVVEMTRPKSDENHEGKMEEYARKKVILAKDLVKHMQSMQETHAKSNLQYIERELLYVKQYHLQEKYSENSSRLNNLVAEVKDQEAALTPEEKRLDRWKERLRKSKDDAHSCTADESKEVSKKPPPNYAALFDQIEARTAEDLEAHVDAIAKDLKNDEKLMKDQEKINRSYQEKKQSIETLGTEIEQLREDKVNALKESDNISTSGVQRLKDLIDNVNDKFSAYFADLGYAGEVRLSRGDVDDYKSYGVAIKVRFRDGEDWSELAKGRQSGGEMSVTTAIYMLALQEMTTVPFRCVDEINQGLDERNERRVWDMILNAATEGGGSQYFYLAPKMPYNLEYKPGTVVHVCHASDTIKRSISSVEQEEGSDVSRWVTAAKRLRDS
eukprot:GFUD01018633.1.p1 GENE.GFUD01018633.1~~GFUD01018633.1.p1  ORF type:complete len:1079 (-),score=372.19 GFUD01018633.1:403-3639(-)